MGWDGMGWDGMGWDGMGWDGMGWDGMGWEGRRGAWRRGARQHGPVELHKSSQAASQVKSGSFTSQVRKGARLQRVHRARPATRARSADRPSRRRCRQSPRPDRNHRRHRHYHRRRQYHHRHCHHRCRAAEAPLEGVPCRGRRFVAARHRAAQSGPRAAPIWAASSRSRRISPISRGASSGWRAPSSCASPRRPSRCAPAIHDKWEVRGEGREDIGVARLGAHQRQHAHTAAAAAAAAATAAVAAAARCRAAAPHTLRCGKHGATDRRSHLLVLCGESTHLPRHQGPGMVRRVHRVAEGRSPATSSGTRDGEESVRQRRWTVRVSLCRAVRAPHTSALPHTRRAAPAARRPACGYRQRPDHMMRRGGRRGRCEIRRRHRSASTCA
jgi:hypothetical protein